MTEHGYMVLKVASDIIVNEHDKPNDEIKNLGVFLSREAAINTMNSIAKSQDNFKLDRIHYDDNHVHYTGEINGRVQYIDYFVKECEIRYKYNEP